MKGFRFPPRRWDITGEVSQLRESKCGDNRKGIVGNVSLGTQRSTVTSVSAALGKHRMSNDFGACVPLAVRGPLAACDSSAEGFIKLERVSNRTNRTVKHPRTKVVTKPNKFDNRSGRLRGLVRKRGVTTSRVIARWVSHPDEKRCVVCDCAR